MLSKSVLTSLGSHPLHFHSPLASTITRMHQSARQGETEEALAGGMAQSVVVFDPQNPRKMSRQTQEDPWKVLASQPSSFGGLWI